MRVANTTQTNNMDDSTKLAKIDTIKDNLVSRYKLGQLTEKHLAYYMHMLGKQEESNLVLDNRNSDELDTQIQMWQAVKRQEPIMYSRAKSRSYGLTRIREVRRKAQRANYYLNNIEE